jgi:O-antigen ligase
VTAPSVISARVLDERFNPHRVRKLSLDVLDYVLFLPSIWLVCALAISLRLIGPLFVVVPIGFCLLYAVLRSTVPPRLLSAYIVFCIFAVILSKYQMFPTSWQVYFREEAIVRQLIPPLGFFAVAWASKAYFRRRLRCGDAFVGTPFILLLGLVVGPAVMLQQGLRYQGDDPLASVVAFYGAFINNILIVMFFVTGRIFLTNDWRRYVGLVTILGIAATTHFAQFKITTAIAVAALFGAPGRIVVIGLIAALVSIYAVGIGHVGDVMIANSNAGIRLAFVADALSSVIDTQGIGIGYGKESVRWRYQFPDMPDFTLLPDPRSITPDRMLELLSTGVHNSFIQALMRTGVLGFLLLLAAFFAAFPPRNLPQDVRNHAAIMFGMIFVACFVNPALESPVQAVGVGFVYGYLLALRASARTRTPKVSKSAMSAELWSKVGDGVRW